MIALTLISALAVGSIFVRAAPTDASVALARKFAPQLRFAKGEKYFGSSVDFFLSGPLAPKDGNGNAVGSGAALTPGSLTSLPDSGSGVFLTTDVSSAALSGFLAGQNPSTPTGAKVYTFVAPKDNGVVDLVTWLFTPYNLGKTVPLLGQVGNHVGDWERIKVRTANGTAVSVEYHAHGDTGSGTIPWNEAPKFDNDQRPAGYIASGSHGLWSSAGTFTYVNAVIFKLQDVTSDGGVQWDTKDDLVVLDYPGSYDGDLSWVNFKGAWGNQGKTDCWWHFIYSECSLVNAPGGPLRDDVLGASFRGKSSLTDKMGSVATHALATVASSHSSSYTVYVKDTTAPYVAVRQTCTAESDGNASHLVHNIEQQADGKFAKRAEPKTNFVYASTPFTASSGRASLSVAACPTGTAVTSYSVAACQSGAVYDCTFTQTRNIRAYSNDPNVSGVQAAQAITIEDLDTWHL